jgi:hypothetical protein
MSDASAVFLELGASGLPHTQLMERAHTLLPKELPFKNKNPFCIILDLDFFNKLG